MAFHGRAREQDQLEAELNKPAPSLVIVSGRRRIGKSTLLRQVVHARPHVYFQATIGPTVINLEAFKDEVTRSVGGSPLLEGIATWEGVLSYLAELSKGTLGLTVVIDEFPYLLEDDKLSCCRF